MDDSQHDHRGGLLFRFQTERRGKVGDWINGDVWVSTDMQRNLCNQRLRKRLGARLFEIADEHLPEKHAQLLHCWSRGASRKYMEWRFRGLVTKNENSGWVSRHLGLIFDSLRRLSDDDMECQLLLAALDMRCV